MRVALDVGESIDAHGARRGDATDVVATEVDEHDVLGDLLFVVQKFVFEFEVLGLVDAARARARDRPVAHQSVVHAHQHLGRGADDLDLAGVQQVHVGRRIEGAQHAVERQRVDGARPLELLTRHDLEDVTGEDVLARTLDDGAVVRAGEVRESLGDRANVDRRRVDSARWRRAVRSRGHSAAPVRARLRRSRGVVDWRVRRRPSRVVAVFDDGVDDGGRRVLHVVTDRARRRGTRSRRRATCRQPALAGSRSSRRT